MNLSRVAEGVERLKHRVLWGAFLCLIAAVSWGAMFPVAHSAFQHIDPFYFTLIRYGAVTVILIGLLLWREGREAFRFEGNGLQLWFFGTMAFAVYNLLIFWGEDLLGESGIMVASVMEALMPMISIVLMWLIFRKRPHFFTSICVIAAFIGAIFVITKGDAAAFLGAASGIIPSILIFIAVVGWVIYTIGGSRFSGWSALRYSTLSCLLGTLTAAVIVAIATMVGYVSLPTTEVLAAAHPHLLFMIIFPGLIALLGWNVGVSILSPLNALLFINFVPVTTLVISMHQGYHITTFDFVGTVFIILSLIANNLFVRLQNSKTYKKVVRPSLREQTS